MPRIVEPTSFKPNLQFRFQAELSGQAPGLKFYGRSVDLPKWTKENGWKNSLKIGCYHFEGITVNELYGLKKENAKLTIKILSPVGTPIYEWRLVGDITGIDYGKVNWGVDDIIQATITFEPNECEIAFEPNKE